MKESCAVISMSVDRLKPGDKKNECRPWLDDNGVIRSDSSLREISKLWDPGTWERFLVETVERSASYMREHPINPRAYGAALDEMTESIWAWTESPQGDVVCDLLRRMIRDHLTPRQQQIVRLLYWNGASERVAAETLGIARSTVVVQKRRVLRKLKKLLQARASIFSLVERVVRPKDSRERVAMNRFEKFTRRRSPIFMESLEEDEIA